MEKYTVVAEQVKKWYGWKVVKYNYCSDYPTACAYANSKNDLAQRNPRNQRRWIVISIDKVS